MKVNKIKFGKFIAERREKIEEVRTQELLADRLNISTGYMGKLETGGGLPSFELFIDLADALLMSPAELIMVMAEREPDNRNYMEMNDWLFGRLLKLMEDYEEMSKAYREQSGQVQPRQPGQPLTPPLPPKNVQAQAAEDLAVFRQKQEAADRKSKPGPTTPPAQPEKPEQTQNKDVSPDNDDNEDNEQEGA
jgi:transcriptional regulator with XRE-family HTH domain